MGFRFQEIQLLKGREDPENWGEFQRASWNILPRMPGLVGLDKSDQKELGYGWEPSMWSPTS